MNEFRGISFDELCSRVCEKKKTLIIYNMNSSADVIASAFALKELLALMGIPAFCACSKEVPEKFRFICEAIQGSVLIDDELGIDHEQVIAIGAKSHEELGEIYSFLRKKVDLSIDIRFPISSFSDYYASNERSSVAEIIFDVAMELKNRGRIFDIDVDILGLIYTGLAASTKCFASSFTNANSHTVAAELIRKGVNTVRINNLLFANKDIKQVKAESEAAHRLNFYSDGKICVSSIPYSTKFSLGLNDASVESAADLPFSISGVELSALIYQVEPNGYFKIFIRSSSPSDIKEVCSRISDSRITGNSELSVIYNGSINDLEKNLVSILKRLTNEN